MTITQDGKKRKRVYAQDTNDKWTEIIIYYYNASILDWDTMWKIEEITILTEI